MIEVKITFHGSYKADYEIFKDGEKVLWDSLTDREKIWIHNAFETGSKVL